MQVLVYGSLKKGGTLDYILRNSKFVKSVEVTLPKTAMYKVTRGSFPFPALLPGLHQASFVGEIYEIDKNTLRWLDGAESYPNFYQRDEVDLGEGYGKVWVYYLTIDNADICDTNKPIKNWDVSYEQNHTYTS